MHKIKRPKFYNKWGGAPNTPPINKDLLATMDSGRDWILLWGLGATVIKNKVRGHNWNWDILEENQWEVGMWSWETNLIFHWIKVRNSKLKNYTKSTKQTVSLWGTFQIWIIIWVRCCWDLKNCGIVIHVCSISEKKWNFWKLKSASKGWNKSDSVQISCN